MLKEVRKLGSKNLKCLESNIHSSPMTVYGTAAAKSLSCVRLFATPWTAARQSPPSVGFSRQEYWSGVPSPSPVYMCTSSLFVHLLINTSVLYLGYCKQCCNEHRDMYIFLSQCFHFLWLNTQNWNWYGSSIFNFLRNIHTFFMIAPLYIPTNKA